MKCPFIKFYIHVQFISFAHKSDIQSPRKVTLSNQWDLGFEIYDGEKIFSYNRAT